MKYKLSKAAQNDLEDIWLYTFENWHIGQADKYINLLIDEIEFIAENFEIARDFSHFRKGCCCSKAGSHIIFFRRNQHSETEVIRVLHQKKDIENRLADGP